MITFFISDTHFCHKNIIKYENRPFKTSEEMDRRMIENWNKVVGKDDLVIHGGDFSLCSKQKATDILNSLNGHKILIKGSHDSTNKRMLDIGFEKVVKHLYFPYSEIYIIHNPKDAEEEMVRESTIVLYGHKHSKLYIHNIQNEKFVNICVENLDYTPRTIQEILERNGKR
jgi:calcineurin-like phosphoesterase family protein